jgi:RimJ/RimL family protein N-acetyltransferase
VSRTRTRPGLDLRLATAADGEAIWRWNNDATVRQMSLDPRAIPRDVHDVWMTDHLGDRDHRMWIVELSGEPIGVVRIARTGGAGPGTISIALDRTARGLGLGRATIKLACARDGGPIVAEILSENRPSIACFEACGFALAHRGPRPGGRTVLTYEWRNVHAIAI